MPTPPTNSDERTAAPATRRDRSFERFFSHGTARAARKGAVRQGRRPETSPDTGREDDAGDRRRYV
jgi:hypothetical protein